MDLNNMASGNDFSESQKKFHYKSGEDLLKVETSSSFSLHESADAIIPVQVLEFKTHLLEAVEELRIQRDTEMRFEEQVNKLVLEKQELEWQKESLQNQLDTLKNQHTDALSALKKQFQARIRGIEGEKGKYLLTAELKDKEMNSLKEELKILQLFKYSLQKKLSELEQKLQLQTQAKDNHLNQLSEVEKHFVAISRQCVAVKQAHEKLELNVEEAVRLNKKCTVVNRTQEATILSLKQDLEKMSNELIKFKVSSVCKTGEESIHQTLQDQHIQQLQHRLHMETEINKRLTKENATTRAEKQEVMNSLKHAQQLLQRQTEAIGRVELELNAQREEYQALKTDNELLREKTQEKEDKCASLMEEYEKFKTIWGKEEERIKDEIQTAQKELQSLKEVYDYLHEQNNQLASCKVHQAEHIQRIEDTLKEKICNADGKIIFERNEISSVSDCEIKEMHTIREEKNSQRESVQLQSSTTHTLTDNSADTIEGNECSQDKCADASFKEPVGTVNDELPKADYRVVINVQTADVYASGSKDTEGTGSICSTADFASANLKPQGSPDTLAKVPVRETMISDSADALGVYSADTGQQTDSSKHKSGMGESHLVYGMLDKNSTTTTTVCNRGDYIGELSSPRGQLVYSVEVDQVAEKIRYRKQEQTACIPETILQNIAKEDNQKFAECTECSPEVTADKSDFNETHPAYLETPDVLSDLSTTSQKDTTHQRETRCLTPEENEVSSCKLQDDTAVVSAVAKCDKLQIEDQMEKEDNSHLTSSPFLTLCQNKMLHTDTSSTAEPQKSLLKEQIIRDSVQEIKQLPADIRHISQDIHTTNNIEVKTGKVSEPQICQSEINAKDVFSGRDLSVNTFVTLSSTPCLKEINRSGNSSDHSFLHNAENATNEESCQATCCSEALQFETSKNEIVSPTREKKNDSEHQDTMKYTGVEIVLHSFDNMLVSGNKRFRSAFELGSLRNKPLPVPLQFQEFVASSKLIQDKIDSSRTSKPPIPSFLKRKSELPPGFEEFHLTSTNPKHWKDHKQAKKDSPPIKRAADMLNTSSFHLCHKRDPGEERNATAQTFCEISSTPEHETTQAARFPIPPHGCLPSQAEPNLNTTPTTVSDASYRHVGTFSVPSPEVAWTESDDLEIQQTQLSDQISGIERFLRLERLSHTKKRKVDGRIKEQKGTTEQ